MLQICIFSKKCHTDTSTKIQLLSRKCVYTSSNGMSYSNDISINIYSLHVSMKLSVSAGTGTILVKYSDTDISNK